MRRLMAFVVTVLVTVAWSAGAMENNSVVTIGSVQSTITIQGIAVASAPATSVIVSTPMLYRQVCVQNLDSANYLACSESINVSTITTSASAGVFIATGAVPGLPFCFEVVAGNQFYCRSSSVTGTSRAVTIRKR